MANPYTWTQPVTTRSSGSERMTYEDMNRITENLAYLAEDYLPGLGFIVQIPSLKTTWANNDIITREDWAAILDAIEVMANAIVLEYTAPSYAMTWDNINLVESLTNQIKDSADAITGVKITRPLMSLSYATGDTLDLTGLKVVAIKSGMEIEIDSSVYATSPAAGATLATSDTALTVSLGRYTASQGISVANAETHWASYRQITFHLQKVSTTKFNIGGGFAGFNGTFTVMIANVNRVRYTLTDGEVSDIDILSTSTVASATALTSGSYEVNIVLSTAVAANAQVRLTVAPGAGYSFDKEGTRASQTLSRTTSGLGAFPQPVFTQVTASHFIVQYSDGYLAINEPTSMHAENEALHTSTTAFHPINWHPDRTKEGTRVKTAEVCAPFAPVDLTYMLFGTTQLTDVVLDLLCGDYVTSADSFIRGATRITTIDLSKVAFTSLEKTSYMFNGCTALTTIVADVFNTDSIETSTSMFTNCTALVGGAGTVYDANYVDATYARIDNPPDEPGYFTAAS